MGSSLCKRCFSGEEGQETALQDQSEEKKRRKPKEDDGEATEELILKPNEEEEEGVRTSTEELKAIREEWGKAIQGNTLS